MTCDIYKYMVLLAVNRDENSKKFEQEEIMQGGE